MGVGELSGPMVSLEFAVTNESLPFVWVASEGGRATLERLVPRGAETYDEFFSVRDVAPDRVVETTERSPDVSARTLARYDDGGLVKFTVDTVCPVVSLAEQGAVPRLAEGVDGVGYVHAEVPPSEDPRAVTEAFLEEYPSAELCAKREHNRSTPLFTRREVEHALLDRLTDRQLEVLFAAVDAGYYEWPREVSGEDLADQLGVSGATLHEHLRRAESALVTTLFERPRSPEHRADVDAPVQ